MEQKIDKKKKDFKEPEFTIILLSDEDVVRTSGVKQYGLLENDETIGGN